MPEMAIFVLLQPPVISEASKVNITVPILNLVQLRSSLNIVGHGSHTCQPKGELLVRHLYSPRSCPGHRQYLRKKRWQLYCHVSHCSSPSAACTGSGATSLSRAVIPHSGLHVHICLGIGSIFMLYVLLKPG